MEKPEDEKIKWDLLKKSVYRLREEAKKSGLTEEKLKKLLED